MKDYRIMDDPLLSPRSTITLPPTTENFVTRNRFVLAMDPKKVMIGYILGDFVTWFMGKVEAPVAESTLRYYELQRNAPDEDILAGVGGEARAETTLTEIFSLMERQRLGKDGILAINGWENIFFVRDQAGTLRSVAVHWCDSAWYVDAARIGRKDIEWPIRDRVFVRVNA